MYSRGQRIFIRKSRKYIELKGLDKLFIRRVLILSLAMIILGQLHAQQIDTALAASPVQSISTEDTSQSQVNKVKDTRSFIVSNAGDTLFGTYKKQVFGHAAFKIAGKKVLLDARGQQAYQVEGILYRSVQVSPATSPVWMECLEDGKIRLYQYIAYKSGPQGGTPRDLPGSSVVWLAQKKGAPLVNVNGVMSTEDQARRNLSNLLQDQPELSAEIMNLPFSTRTVQGLIAAYNRNAKALKY
ncbi:MAG TPA: hypothetical protein VL053_05755 [Arachidicoccus sp.]|nr:hypothetical protein [Arachidicoccus sp.]